MNKRKNFILIIIAALILIMSFAITSDKSRDTGSEKSSPKRTYTDEVMEDKRSHRHFECSVSDVYSVSEDEYNRYCKLFLKEIKKNKNKKRGDKDYLYRNDLDLNGRIDNKDLYRLSNMMYKKQDGINKISDEHLRLMLRNIYMARDVLTPVVVMVEFQNSSFPPNPYWRGPRDRFVNPEAGIYAIPLFAKFPVIRGRDRKPASSREWFYKWSRGVFDFEGEILPIKYKAMHEVEFYNNMPMEEAGHLLLTEIQIWIRRIMFDEQMVTENQKQKIRDIFSRGDKDGDGVIDCFVVLPAQGSTIIYNIEIEPEGEYESEGENNNNNSPGLWPRFSVGEEYELFDEYRISPYIILNDDIQDLPRLFCHELGHFLGLPDMYVPFEGPNPNLRRGAGRWCLMSNGMNPSAFFYYKTNWRNVTTIQRDSFVRIRDSHAQLNNSIFRLLPSGNSEPDEYFLIEYKRIGELWTREYPEDPEGLWIWHIKEEEFLPFSTDVHLEQADGFYNLNYKDTDSNAGDSGDLFKPSNEFTLSSNPNSRKMDDTESGISIRNISEWQDSIYVDVHIRERL